MLEGLLQGLTTFDRFLADDHRGLRGAWRRSQQLRRPPFDWAVLLPDSVRAAVGPFLAGVPRRVGYARDVLRRALINDALPLPRDSSGRRTALPTVERYLRITRHVGCADRGDDVELAVDPRARESVETELARLGVGSGERLLVVAPGAGFGPSKLWPAEHFAEACTSLAARRGLRAVLAPAPGECTLAAMIAGRSPGSLVWRADGSATLAALKALVARSDLVLSNDTGPRHVAVALGVPVVVLMGPTNPLHTASQQGLQRVLREDVECSPCQKRVCPIDHRCMTRLTPDRVTAAADELLGSGLAG